MAEFQANSGESESRRHALNTAILLTLLDATRAGQITWRSEKLPDEWYSTTIDGQDISFRLHWYESVNQPGADPRFFEFCMPHMNATFAFGTVGADLLFEILSAAFPKWEAHNDPTEAYSWIRESLSKESE